MRLTKQMKENLFNIILNKLTPPKINKDKYQKEYTKLIDNLLGSEWKRYKRILLKQMDKIKEEDTNYYVGYERINHSINIMNNLSKDFITTDYISTMVPSSSVVVYLFNKQFGSSSIFSFQPTEEQKDLNKFFRILYDYYKEFNEYVEIIQVLKTTIYNCNTDKQLKDIYPEFVQYFNLAGITQTVKKQLPIKYRLSENLAKYGLKIKNTKGN